MPQLTLNVSGKDFQLKNISVRQTPVGQEADLYYGNMGLDVFGAFKKLTISFQDMYLRVE